MDSWVSCPSRPSMWKVLPTTNEYKTKKLPTPKVGGKTENVVNAQSRTIRKFYFPQHQKITKTVAQPQTRKKIMLPVPTLPFHNPLLRHWNTLTITPQGFHWEVNFANLSFQLYELSEDPKRKEFLDELFAFMQKRGRQWCSLEY